MHTETNFAFHTLVRFFSYLPLNILILFVKFITVKHQNTTCISGSMWSKGALSSSGHFTRARWSKVAKTVMLLTYIQEVSGSGLSLDTYGPEVFMVLLSPSRQMPGFHHRLGYDCFLPHHFRFIIQYNPIIWHYVVWVTERVIKLTTKKTHTHTRVTKYPNFNSTLYIKNCAIQGCSSPCLLFESNFVPIYFKRKMLYTMKYQQNVSQLEPCGLQMVLD
jgi:hypothetical protein